MGFIRIFKSQGDMAITRIFDLKAAAIYPLDLSALNLDIDSGDLN